MQNTSVVLQGFFEKIRVPVLTRCLKVFSLEPDLIMNHSVVWFNMQPLRIPQKGNQRKNSEYQSVLVMELVIAFKPF